MFRDVLWARSRLTRRYAVENSAMKMSAYLITCLLLFAGSTGGCTSSAADDLVEMPVREWDEVYELSEVIELKGVTRLGGVNDLDVSEDGSLLVVDVIQRAVFVFGNSGELEFHLPLETCSLRDHVVASNGRFSGDGRVLIDNRGMELFWFSADGDCRGPLSLDVPTPRRYAIDSAGRIVGLHVVPDSHYVSILDGDGQLQSHVLSWTEYSGITSKVRGGGVVTVNGTLYVAMPANPRIIEVDLSYMAKREIGQTPETFQPLADHYRDNVAVADEDTEYIRETLESGSLTFNLFLVDDRTVAVRYRRRDAGGFAHSIQIVDIETGSSIYVVDIPSIAAAGNGAFYVPKLYSPTGAFLPSPQIEVYRPRSDQ